MLPSEAELSSESPSFTKFRKTYFCTRSPLRVSVGYSKCITQGPKDHHLYQIQHSRETNITPETPIKSKLIVPDTHTQRVTQGWPGPHTITHHYIPPGEIRNRITPGQQHTQQAQLHFTLSGLNNDKSTKDYPNSRTKTKHISNRGSNPKTSTCQNSSKITQFQHNGTRGHFLSRPVFI